MPPLASGPGDSGPIREVSAPVGPVMFHRSVRTGGLYDDTLLRRLHLRFEQPDWQDLLIAAHGTCSNVLCRLEVDNGTVLAGVGACYKGDSSFSPLLPRKSLNLLINYLHAADELLGYEALNLNNAQGDGTVLREAILFNVMHRYAPGPRGALATLFDGVEPDESARDGRWAARIPPQLAGTTLSCYIEARTADKAGVAAYFPPRAESGPLVSRVTQGTPGNCSVVISEFMASNSRTILDPQGDADDWIELHNRTEEAVDLAGCYLSDDPENSRK
jgi:hypothetical protein